MIARDVRYFTIVDYAQHT